MCGHFRYEATGQAVISGACYCRDCQYVSGGAPANVLVMLKADVKVTAAMPPFAVCHLWTCVLSKTTPGAYSL
jgi:hypothetical protein